MSTIYLVANDSNPPLRVQLGDATGSYIDLTSPAKTVWFKFRKRGTTTVLFTQQCDKVAGGEAVGQIEMVWPLTGLAIAAGSYEGEFYVIDTTSGDTRVQTCYDVQKFKVRLDF